MAKEKNESELFVSFSGGKDSTVVSDLVINALPDKNIIHIFVILHWNILLLKHM